MDVSIGLAHTAPDPDGAGGAVSSNFANTDFDTTKCRFYH
jgi:hypothetical protein